MGCTDVDMAKSHEVNERKVEVWGTLFCVGHFLLWFV